MKGFEKAIKHPLFKYVMYTLAVINLYGYVTKKKFNCLLSFVAAVMVTHYFIRKNIPLALIVGLFISTFVLGCGKILEGNTSGSEMTKEQAGNIADALKLSKGKGKYAFVGNYGTKGLYAYKSGGYRGVAFFGTGGDTAQQQSELDGNKYRPVKAVQEAGELLSLTPVAAPCPAVNEHSCSAFIQTAVDAKTCPVVNEDSCESLIKTAVDAKTCPAVNEDSCKSLIKTAVDGKICPAVDRGHM